MAPARMVGASMISPQRSAKPCRRILNYPKTMNNTENKLFWSLDCDILRGDPESSVKVATATDVIVAKELVAVLNGAYADTARLNYLGNLMEACPHTKLCYDEEIEEGGRPWVIETSGCETVRLEGHTLRELIDQSIDLHASGEDFKVWQEMKAREFVVRELMVALEYLRFACEHAEGKNAKERRMLSRAMSVGIRVGAKHKDLLGDYQRETYWEEVWGIPAKVGLPNMK